MTSSMQTSERLSYLDELMSGMFIIYIIHILIWNKERTEVFWSVLMSQCTFVHQYENGHISYVRQIE